MSHSGPHTEELQKVPGANWRFLAHDANSRTELENKGIFDELVVDNWLHVEQMDERVWWLMIGDARILVTIDPNGAATVDIERGFYAPMRGKTVNADLDESAGAE